MKTFFLGCSKMGTSSVSKSLKNLNCKVLHSPTYGVKSHLKHPDPEIFEQYDFFLDGSFHNFINLKKWYPDARFVLLQRDPVDWLHSMYNWVNHIDDRHMKDDRWLVLLNRLIMNRRVLLNMITSFKIFQLRVLNFFEGNSDFIEVNLVNGDPEEWKRLSKFMQLDLEENNTNQQQKKSDLHWGEDLDRKSDKRLEKYDLTYPDSNSLFQWSMGFLSRNFIHERHFTRNLKNAFKSKSPLSKATMHIIRFLGMILSLAIRTFTTPRYILSPFIY